MSITTSEWQSELSKYERPPMVKWGPAYWRWWRQDQKLRGMCSQCTGQVEPGSVLCIRCRELLHQQRSTERSLAMRREQCRRYRARRREE